MEAEAKSLLPSLYKREAFPLFGKEGLGEILITICLSITDFLLEDFLELLGPMPDFIVREFPNG